MNKKALALVIVGLVILAAIVYFIFFYDFGGGEQTTTPPPPPTTAEPVVSTSSPSETVKAEPRSIEQTSRDNAQQLAIYFADRYGSSSNQADFSNLLDLQVFMTDAFKTRTNAFIEAERAKTPATTDYEGITTKAIIAEFSSFNETAGTASGTVKTKRQQTKTDGTVTSFDQDLTITLKKVSGDWKVDSATWK